VLQEKWDAAFATFIPAGKLAQKSKYQTRFNTFSKNKIKALPKEEFGLDSQQMA
jgi:hypothetical protein